MGHEARKAQYDHERWLSGRFNKNRSLAITPEYLLQEAKKLNKHLATVDVYRMNRQLLHEYLLLLLQDSYIGIMQLKAGKATISMFIAEILQSSRHLPYYYDKDILGRLGLLVQKEEEDRVNIAAAIRERKRAYLLQKNFPWIILGIAILLCIFMYLFSKKN